MNENAGEREALELFERACECDTAGLEAEAEPLYRAALATGMLDPYRQVRATLQLASTLRLMGRLQESEAILLRELDSRGEAGGDLHDEARTLLALTWIELGRGAEAAGLLLAVLAPKLSRYNRSMSRQAVRWTKRTWSPPVE